MEQRYLQNNAKKKKLGTSGKISIENYTSPPPSKNMHKTVYAISIFV
jgi:hypothetical protein